MHKHSKTQLSRSIIDQLSLQKYTLWLNAGSQSSLQESLRGAAIGLQHELLRLESIPTQPNAAQDGGFFYTTTARIDYLVELLKVWLSMAQRSEGGTPQVLVVLDDADGLESSELSELSKLVIGDGIDVIFSTRDPTIADQTSYMDATNFDVPPLQEDQAQDLLNELTKVNVTHRKVSTATVKAARSSTETQFLSNVAVNPGYLPAALVSGSHYLTDHLASRNPYALNSYLARWDSPADRRQILEFRRKTSRYPHTILASFEVSLRRLRRNTRAECPKLYFCSLNLLRLLSALKISRFERVELESLCALLGPFIQAEGTQNIAQLRQEENDLLASMRQLSEDASKAPRCATELVNVSLLTIPDGTDIMVLNQLIRASVLLRAQDSPAADQSLRDLALDEAESQLLERAACHISRNWAPCSPPPKPLDRLSIETYG